MKITLDLSPSQFHALCQSEVFTNALFHLLGPGPADLDQIVLDKAKEIAESHSGNKIAAIKSLREWSKTFLAEHPEEAEKYESHKSFSGANRYFGLRVSKELIEKCGGVYRPRL